MSLSGPRKTAPEPMIYGIPDWGPGQASLPNVKQLELFPTVTLSQFQLLGALHT